MYDFMDMGFDDSAEIPETTGVYIPSASECMRCGLCVSNCPTFRLFQIDEETPRRRIRTISKLLVEDTPISHEERQHLDNCLQCRACETTCPSRMDYGPLFDQAHAHLKSVASGWTRLAFWFIENKHWRMRLMPLLAVYLKSGLQKPLQRSGLLKKLHLADAEALLGKPELQTLSDRYPTTVPLRSRVALFTGCVAEHFDRPTLQASIKLLNVIGFEVLIPAKQGCCGAIHQHNSQSATDLIDNNISIFNALDVEAVVHTASGCGAMLSEYPINESAAAQQFQQRLYDINTFLLEHWPDDLQLKPATLKVAVHEPCSQRNVLKNQASVYALLKKIPGINVVALADNAICCGAGGAYMLTHPDNAAQLRTLKQHCINEAAADVVVSSNFGCSAFFNAEGNQVEHPVLLLARQLPL